jgi:hypothetical protein
LLGVLAGLGVAVLAGTAFVVTYSDLRALAVAGHASKHLAPAYPVMFDALITVTILAQALALAARRGWWPRLVRWLLLVALLAGAGAASVDRAVSGYSKIRHDWLKAGVAVAPHVMLLIAVWLWLGMFRHARTALANRAAARPDTEPARPDTDIPRLDSDIPRLDSDTARPDTEPARPGPDHARPGADPAVPALPTVPAVSSPPVTEADHVGELIPGLAGSYEPRHEPASASTAPKSSTDRPPVLPPAATAVDLPRPRPEADTEAASSPERTAETGTSEPVPPDAPKSDAPKSDASKSDASKLEIPKPDAPQPPRANPLALQPPRAQSPASRPWPANPLALRPSDAEAQAPQPAGAEAPVSPSSTGQPLRAAEDHAPSREDTPPASPTPATDLHSLPETDTSPLRRRRVPPTPSDAPQDAEPAEALDDVPAPRYSLPTDIRLVGRPPDPSATTQPDIVIPPLSSPLSEAEIRDQNKPLGWDEPVDETETALSDDRAEDPDAGDDSIVFEDEASDWSAAAAEDVRKWAARTVHDLRAAPNPGLGLEPGPQRPGPGPESGPRRSGSGPESGPRRLGSAHPDQQDRPNDRPALIWQPDDAIPTWNAERPEDSSPEDSRPEDSRPEDSRPKDFPPEDSWPEDDVPRRPKLDWTPPSSKFRSSPTPPDAD